MSKKQYIIPSVKIIMTQAPRLLVGTGTPAAPETERMEWSGNKSGTAGPDEIDDYSTIDVF